MRIAIHQPQFMPWIGYFHKMHIVDRFILLDDVQFKKNEWQNRNRIRGPQGWQWLTVPNHYSFPEKICEVTLKNEDSWQEKHVKTLETNYKRSSCYNQIELAIQSFYNQKWETMDKVCIDSVKMLAVLLHIDTPLEISSNYSFKHSSTERLIEICNFFGADTYIAGAGAHNYMDLSLFEKSNIKVEFQNFTSPKYKQHWSISSDDFIADLSVLDLLFNCGEQSGEIIKSIR